MTVLRRSRRLAQAGGTTTLIRSPVAAGWGYNGQGQLGDGTLTSRSGYSDIRVGNDVVQVAAGSGHGLALRFDGTVWAWGFNGAGELGDGTTTSRSTPVRVTGLSGVTQVAACSFFSAALRSDGTVWAWGDDSAGQLGNAPSSTPVTRPVNTIGAGSGITQLSAGDFHMLALKPDGTVLAWGENGYGQLGNGSTAPVTGPVQVTGLANATQVAAGGGFSLAVHVPVPLPVVPDLTGDITARAGQVLQDAGLVLGTVIKAVDNSGNNIGTVMSQNPLAGTTVSPGSAVSITIGTRPPHPCP